MTLGKDLMVSINGKTVQFATNHTFEFNPTYSTVSTLTKDTLGNAQRKIMTDYTWTVTTDNLMAWDGDTKNTDTPAGNTYLSLLALAKVGTEVDLEFGIAGTFSTTTGWSITGSKLTGKAFVAANNISASVSDSASYSVSFEGNGNIEIV